MGSLWRINSLVAFQLVLGIVPGSGFCGGRSPILHLDGMGDLSWEEYRIVSSHSQASVSHTHDAVDVDCRTAENHKVRRASVWIENDYFNVDEEEEFDLTEDQSEAISSFFGGSSSKVPLLLFQKSGMGYGSALAPQTVFSGSEAGTENNNIVEFLENRGYAVSETAAGA